MKFQVVAVNRDDPKEFYNFIEFDTQQEAVIYIRSKEKDFRDCGNWLLEIRTA